MAGLEGTGGHAPRPPAPTGRGENGGGLRESGGVARAPAPGAALAQEEGIR